MRVLIDECLHSCLVEVAEANGHEATHVNWLGLAGSSDRSLMDRILDSDYTFVTNNAEDFRRLYARAELHAGLIIFLPQVRPGMQQRLLQTVFDALQPGEIPVNEVIEVAVVSDRVTIVRYPLPTSE